MTFIHTLLVCVKEPNKLVLAVFQFLSCKYTIAAIVSRSILFVEFVSVVRFVTNRLVGRRDVFRLGTIAVDALRRHLPRGHFLQQVREMKDDLVWHQALDGWAKQQADFSTLVYKCSVEYGRLWPHFFRLGCEAVANGLEKYLDPDGYPERYR